MKKIKLLDCTLRDGGYINNWDFGEEHIESTIHLLEKANIDILELGFLRDEASNPNRTIFQTTKEVNSLIPEKKKGLLYAAMTEVFRPVPMENIEEKNENPSILFVSLYGKINMMRAESLSMPCRRDMSTAKASRKKVMIFLCNPQESNSIPMKNL